MTTESNMFEFYNPNPYEKNVGDCTVRAISKALEQDWYRTYLGLCIEGAVRGDMPSANATWLTSGGMASGGTWRPRI